MVRYRLIQAVKILTVRFGENLGIGLGLSPSVKYFTDRSKAVLLLGFVLFMFCDCHAFAFVHCCFVVT